MNPRILECVFQIFVCELFFEFFQFWLRVSVWLTGEFCTLLSAIIPFVCVFQMILLLNNLFLFFNKNKRNSVYFNRQVGMKCVPRDGRPFVRKRNVCEMFESTRERLFESFSPICELCMRFQTNKSEWILGVPISKFWVCSCNKMFHEILMNSIAEAFSEFWAIDKR